MGCQFSKRIDEKGFAYGFFRDYDGRPGELWFRKCAWCRDIADPLGESSMAIWDEIKEGLSKTLTDVESKAHELKETVHSEFELIRLKSELEELRKEEDEVFLDMGQKLYQLLISETSLDSKHFKSQLDYLEGLKLKVDNLQVKINEFYTEPKKNSEENPEIVVDPSKGEGK